MVAPLRLKSEKVGKTKISLERPFLRVLVDTGVFHLDQEYDYLLPQKYDLAPGQWASVPFRNRNCAALIVSRSDHPSETIATSKILPINRPIRAPFVDTECLNFYREVAQRWGSPIFDVLRFIGRRQSNIANNPIKGQGKRVYQQLSPYQDEISQLRDIASRISKTGRTLLLVPERRTLELLASGNYEIGMRGMVLSPELYTNLIILREESEHHYELKSPGFNTRDVALLRNEILSENLLFLSYSPSIELARLIESGYVSFSTKREKIDLSKNIAASPSQQGEILPSALIKTFREKLKKGPILVIVPSKGYGLALSCANCRNVATCECGGKLSKKSRNANPACVICSKEVLDWRCRFCNRSQIYLLGRGIERIAEEFGRTFRNTTIHISSADKSIAGEFEKGEIILATVGAAPQSKFSLTVFLEGMNLGADLRSEERYLSTLFRYSAFSSGNALIVTRSEHPAVNALVRWEPLPYLFRVLEGLKDAQLPPHSRNILLKCNPDESARVFSGLQSSIREGRIPSDTRIYNLNTGVISIISPIKNSKKVLSFIYEYQKRRSISGKELLKLRVDPYLLG